MNEYPARKKDKPVVEEGIRFYSSPEEQEQARLRDAIRRTDSEKFFFLMNLMKLQRLMKKGTLHHED